MSSSFCAALWYNLFYKEASGKYKPCCVYQPQNNKTNTTLNGFVNSEEMIKARQESLNGEWPAGCTRCKINEDAGAPSDRIYENIRHDIRNSEDHLDIKPTIKVLDYRPGNLCNLKCRSCNPEDSSQIVKEIEKTPELARYYSSPIISKPYLDRLIDKIDYGSEMNPELLDHDIVKNLEQVKMIGGEPSIDPRVHNYIEWLIEHGYSKNLKLRYTTNGTNVNSKWIDYHKHFKRVVISISLDGAGKTFEYIRTPAKWSTIKNNVHKLAEVSNHLNINFVYSLWNCFTVGEYFHQLINLSNSGVKQITVIPSMRYNQHPRILPESYKEKVRNMLNILPRDTDMGYKFISSCKKSLNMSRPSGSDAAIKNFFDFNSELDVVRGTDLFEISSLYRKLYDDINK